MLIVYHVHCAVFYRALKKYTTLSLSDEDLRTSMSLMDDPELQGFINGKSFSSASINGPLEESNNNVAATKVSSVSINRLCNILVILVE